MIGKLTDLPLGSVVVENLSKHYGPRKPNRFLSLTPLPQRIRNRRERLLNSERRRDPEIDDEDEEELDDFMPEEFDENESKNETSERQRDALTEAPSNASQWVLKDISFQIQPGTGVAVIGPNGAGKSTLIKILSRITLPTEGRAIISGEAVPLTSATKSFVHPYSTGRENIFFIAQIFGFRRSTAEQAIDEIIAFGGLGGVIDKPIMTYSRGLYTRLLFSTLINLKPAVLLADDAIRAGDPAFRIKLVKRIKEDISKGSSLIFASHNLEILRELCDYALWIDRGRIVEYDDINTVISNYTSVYRIQMHNTPMS